MDSGIELSHRKRTPVSPSSSADTTVSSNSSLLPVSSSNWAESASLDEPRYIPSISPNPYSSSSNTNNNNNNNTGININSEVIEKFHLAEDEDGTHSTLKSLSFNQLKPIDKKNFLVLVFLYLLQGIPVGLAFGSIPFLLKSRLSYGQVGIFTLASYPYSLKLLWSPIVDAFYNRQFGRRKSWIVPIQTISAFVLLYLGGTVEPLLENAEQNLFSITMCFFTLVFLCATQDIAVDGWALTLLTQEALSYASTAQTVGLNTGYFMSFTVFLAFNSPEFANKYFRDVPSDTPLVSLSQYLVAWGWIYLVATIAVGILKREERTRNDSGGIIAVYRSMYKVLRLYNIQILIMVHLVAKIGFQANEAVTNLKLLEKGLSKEDLALTVLIDFPFEIIFGYYAAKWSTGSKPLQPWMRAYLGRILCAILSMLAVVSFPKSGNVGVGYFLIIIITHVLGSFMSTIQFVSINAFHTQIADPTIGGTYMTTLNTISNLGGQWPRLIVLYAVDWFTQATCVPPVPSGLEDNTATTTVGTKEGGSGATAAAQHLVRLVKRGAEKLVTTAIDQQQQQQQDNLPVAFSPFSCSTEAGKGKCREIGGQCNVQTDGYYVANTLCVVVGLVLFFVWIRKKMMHLQSLPTSSWRVDPTSY